MAPPEPRAVLVHWHDDAPHAIGAALAAAGWSVDARVPRDGPAFLRALRAAPPQACVIDLGRRPTGGRDVALALAQSPATRAVPLLFIGADAVQRAAIGALLPHAAFATPRGIGTALRRLGRTSPPPARPLSALAGYSGTPLPRKLGVKPGTTLALLGAPDGFDATLGDLPDDVLRRDHGRGAADLVLWFVRSRAELARGIGRVAARGDLGALWICWPKKTSRLAAPDLGENEVRRAGLDHGLVDYKVCAIDADWSGLKFAWRGRSRR